MDLTAGLPWTREMCPTSGAAAKLFNTRLWYSLQMMTRMTSRGRTILLTPWRSIFLQNTSVFTKRIFLKNLWRLCSLPCSLEQVSWWHPSAWHLLTIVILRVNPCLTLSWTTCPINTGVWMWASTSSWSPPSPPSSSLSSTSTDWSSSAESGSSSASSTTTELSHSSWPCFPRQMKNMNVNQGAMIHQWWVW